MKTALILIGVLGLMFVIGTVNPLAKQAPPADPAQQQQNPDGSEPTVAQGKSLPSVEESKIAKLGSKAVKLAGDLRIEDLKVGTGKTCPEGATVTVHYTGWLTDGTKFDSSVDKGTPLNISLDSVVRGWGQGIPGMKVGGKRKLVIPPDLGYGERGGGSIPPGAWLIFEVELIDVQGA